MLLFLIPYKSSAIYFLNSIQVRCMSLVCCNSTNCRFHVAAGICQHQFSDDYMIFNNASWCRPLHWNICQRSFCLHCANSEEFFVHRRAWALGAQVQVWLDLQISQMKTIKALSLKRPKSLEFALVREIVLGP